MKALLVVSSLLLGFCSLAAAQPLPLEAFAALARHEGIIPALESAHAVAHGLRRARELNREEVLVINLSGRGDKDLQQVAERSASGKEQR